MSSNISCDTSANQYITEVNTRIDWLQGPTITAPPKYGRSNLHPTRGQRCNLAAGQIMTFTQANKLQEQYKKEVLGSKNGISYVATRAEKLTRVMNGFTASGQPSAQYGTQNWGYTNADARQSNLLGNNTLSCDIPSGFNNWFSVVIDASGNNAVACTTTNAYYKDSDIFLTNNLDLTLTTPLSISSTPYLAMSHTILSDISYAYITGTDLIYRSLNGGVNWDGATYSWPKTGQKGITKMRSITTDISGSKNIFIGSNAIGTTFIGLNYIGSATPFSQDKSQYLPYSNLPTTPNNNVYFTDMVSCISGSNLNTSMDVLWSCGYYNTNYIFPPYSTNTPGNYIWRSDNSGSSWEHGWNIATGKQGNGSTGPENPFWPGCDVSLTIISVNLFGDTLAVAGNKSHLSSSTTNFWVNTDPNLSPIFTQWGPGGGASINGFSNIAIAYNWYAIAMSDNGSVIAASSAERQDFENAGYVYISTNTGSTVKKSTLPLGIWKSISVSSDGLTIIVCSDPMQFNPNSVSLLTGGYVYISTDKGLNWIQQVVVK